MRWLRWADDREAILALRHAVFVEEQGFSPDIIVHPRDETGIHLGAFLGGRLVAGVTAYVFEAGAPELAAHGLPPVDGVTVQYTKRLELAPYRGHGVTEALGANIVRYVFECLRPARSFLILAGVHRKLQDHYRKLFDFRHHGDVGEGDDVRTVMTIDGDAALRTAYLKMRAMAESVHRRCPVVVPSLVRALVDEGRAGLLASDRLGRENHYVGPLSLADELPRLAAQNRLLYAEQRPRLAATNWGPAPRRLLDVGTGTGVYLQMMAKDPALVGTVVRGVELSPQLLAYARFSFPHADFVAGSAYATGEPDAAYDVVTANFVLIHLRNPDLALLEFWRILRPGGLLYIVDVNDTTFTGPDVIRTMVEEHHRWHEADRRILATLPRRAAEFGFEPVARHSTTVRNTGGAEPTFAPDEIRLGRMSMWGVLSFMGQREELEEAFQEAQEHYLGTECEISLNVETHVYRKPGG